jgi:hypothetical protein
MKFKTHRSPPRRPMSDATASGAYLGIYVAERALSKFFENITRMPPNNRGYDYVCSRGYKIDVKSACITTLPGKVKGWHFNINRNTIADYFLCLAFDNRTNLEPMHVWLIPGRLVNESTNVRILLTAKSISRWATYEKSLDKVIVGCALLKIPVVA